MKNYKKLKQRCEDLEVILRKYIQQNEVSSFEMDIFVRLFSDPITFQVEANEEDMRLYRAITRLNDITDDLERKHSRLQAGQI